MYFVLGVGGLFVFGGLGRADACDEVRGNQQHEHVQQGGAEVEGKDHAEVEIHGDDLDAVRFAVQGNDPEVFLE